MREGKKEQRPNFGRPPIMPRGQRVPWSIFVWMSQACAWAFLTLQLSSPRPCLRLSHSSADCSLWYVGSTFFYYAVSVWHPQGSRRENEV